LGLTLSVLLVFWAMARGGEQPLSAALRAAAAAVRPAVVDVEVTRPGLGVVEGEPGEPFVIPGPGGEDRREWRFEFRFPPGVDMPEGFPLGPRGGPGGFAGPRRAAGILVAVEGNRGLIAAPQPTVAGAKEATVRLADGRELKAKVLGTDPGTALACLEVQADKLAAIKPAKAEAVQVGDWVVAVGGPRAGGAITVGIVSAKDQPGAAPLVGTQVLLTDAFLPESMAGAPIVTLQGEVVGMALVPTAQGGRRGRELTPVLPIATLLATLDPLAKGQRVTRGWLGVNLIPAPPEAGRGVRVAQAMPNQPAANAGIRDGDIIVEFDGKKVTDVDGLRALVSAKKPGERVAVKLLRAGDEMILEVTLGEQPALEAVEMPGVPRLQPGPRPGAPLAPQPPVGPAPPVAGGEQLFPGLTVQALTPELAAAFGFAGEQGLVATAVDANSVAAKARPAPVERGDLIKEIARKPVTTLAEAKAAIEEARKANAKTLILLVRSKEGARYLVLDLPQ
jgi:serine protease Do